MNGNPYNLKSRKCPPTIPQLEQFENDMFSMINNIKFRSVTTPFQTKLKNDITNVNNSDKVYVFADKSRNIYKMEKESYKKLLKENITSSYKTADKEATTNINCHLKEITTKLNIASQVETMTTTDAFISLKDHKENFQNKPKCRLINPAKNNLGAISKSIVENINKTVRTSTKLNQWRNTADVIAWFKSLDNKPSLSFIVFDIADFYPLITEQLLSHALKYVSQYIEITQQQTEIIRHSRKTLLFSENKAWSKRNNADMFDVSMGSLDGTEICELVGLFILDKLRSEFKNDDIGLYQDDGLAAFKNVGARTSNNIGKRFAKCFKKHGLNITIQTNQKIVDYLDVTFDLNNGSFRPYRKPNNEPIYINVQSNQPPSIIRQTPISINQRITDLSCNAEEFYKASKTYNKALKESGFSEQLVYKPREAQQKSRKNRTRNIIWFNPPYSANVQTNVGRSVLEFVDKHFPPDNPLHKFFNRNFIKISYGCMNNVANIIKSHNKKILCEEKMNEDGYNCRKKADCPLKGQCLATNVVYQAKVTEPNKDPKVYIGMAEIQFKTRFNNHKLSFKHKKHANKTILSKHIWDLEENKREHKVEWAKPYSSGNKTCCLCSAEKMAILSANKKLLLNKRSELISKCRHENKFYASNVT